MVDRAAETDVLAPSAPDFALRLADGPEDARAAARLRYRCFAAELGAEGPGIDHVLGEERDAFDPHFRQLLLVDRNRPSTDQVIGVYRLARAEDAARAGGFYSAAEYDLGPLLASGRRVMELGRSCLHPDYRGGQAMYLIWQGLAGLVEQWGIEILFGVASFHGTDTAALAQPLSYLYHRHLAPPDLRVTARPRQPMDLLPPEALDVRQAMLAMPALIKAYLRLGGLVGDGAFVDQAFNCIDVCLIMDTARLNARQRDIYTKARS